MVVMSVSSDESLLQLRAPVIWILPMCTIVLVNWISCGMNQNVRSRINSCSGKIWPIFEKQSLLKSIRAHQSTYRHIKWIQSRELQESFAPCQDLVAMTICPTVLLCLHSYAVTGDLISTFDDAQKWWIPLGVNISTTCLVVWLTEIMWVFIPEKFYPTSRQNKRQNMALSSDYEGSDSRENSSRFWNLYRQLSLSFRGL